MAGPYWRFHVLCRCMTGLAGNGMSVSGAGEGQPKGESLLRKERHGRIEDDVPVRHLPISHDDTGPVDVRATSDFAKDRQCRSQLSASSLGERTL